MRPHHLLVALICSLPLAATAAPARPAPESPFSIELPKADALPGSPTADPYIEAVSLLLTGKLEAAEQGFQKILRGSPNSAPARLGLAEIAFRRKQFDLGEKYLREALRVNPADPHVQSSLGRFEAQRGNPKAALIHLQEAVRLAPRSVAARMDLGDYYNGLGQRPDLALKEYQQVLAAQPEHAGAHYASAVAHQKNGHKDKAGAAFRKAMTLAPDNPIPFEGLARLQISDKQPQDALRTLDDILSRHPNLARPRILRSEILSAIGKPAEALQELERVEQGSPRNLEYVLRLAMAYHAQNRTKEAIEKYRRAIALDEKSALAHNNWAAILVQQGKAQGEAERLARKAVELDSRNADYQETLGQALLASGKRDDALKVFDRARALSPDDPVLLASIGQGLARHAMPAQARPYLERALSLSNNFVGHEAARQTLESLNK
jgi:tetratricopeptide (TPR) repeat protein